MTDHGLTFEHSNLPRRPAGALVRGASALLPGVRQVQAQVEPFARRWAAANLDALGREGPLWVALGDSMTQGIGAPEFDRGWVGQVAARLAAGGNPHRVVNLSTSGATVADLLDHQLPTLRGLPAPSLVTVLIGSNDIFGRRHRDGLADRMRRLLTELPAGPDVRTVVATLVNPNPIARQLNAAISEVAADRGLVVAEMRDPRTRSWRGKLAADLFHPNERGYRGLAEIFADTLTNRP